MAFSTACYRPYQSESAPTFDQYANVITGEYHAVDNDADLQKTVIQLYSELIDKQESLGADLEKVLFEKLWELYES